VEQLEEGVMDLWRDTWNKEALAFRKRHYRQLLRARREQVGQEVPDETEEYYALTNDV
jgi:hypothetical protein